MNDTTPAQNNQDFSSVIADTILKDNTENEKTDTQEIEDILNYKYIQSPATTTLLLSKLQSHLSFDKQTDFVKEAIRHCEENPSPMRMSNLADLLEAFQISAQCELFDCQRTAGLIKNHNFRFLDCAKANTLLRKYRTAVEVYTKAKDIAMSHKELCDKTGFSNSRTLNIKTIESQVNNFINELENTMKNLFPETTTSLNNPTLMYEALERLADQETKDFQNTSRHDISALE